MILQLRVWRGLTKSEKEGEGVMPFPLTCLNLSYLIYANIYDVPVISGEAWGLCHPLI